MSRRDEEYAALMLEWARTLDQHRDPDYERWIAKRMKASKQ